VALFGPATTAALAQATAPTGGSSGTIGGAIALVMVALAIGVGLYDLQRRREQKALELQARLSDALFQNPVLPGLAITPTVHAPFWPSGPVVVDLAGSAPSPGLRDAVLQVVRREADRISNPLRVEDRIAVNPRTGRYAA
jgi:hypothetical protein